MERIRIRDSGWKQLGSGINIPVPQHCKIDSKEGVEIIGTYVVSQCRGDILSADAHEVDATEVADTAHCKHSGQGCNYKDNLYICVHQFKYNTSYYFWISTYLLFFTHTYYLNRPTWASLIFPASAALSWNPWAGPCCRWCRSPCPKQRELKATHSLFLDYIFLPAIF